MTAAYVVGLLDKIIQVESPDKRIFNLLQSWLGFLDQNGRGMKPFNFLLLADVFIIKLFYFLGFDITVARGSLKVKSILKFVLGAKWEDVNSLKLDKNLGVLIHETVYAFVVYHSECKIPDWKKLAKIGQI